MTNDVEEVSIVNNNLNPKIAKKVSEKGIPRLLELYAKFDVESTFYFTGTFASRFPESVQSVIDHGHEVGCHGYSHLHQHSFDNLSLENQYRHLSKAKSIIEEVSGSVKSFRAPALRIGHGTPLILDKLGFKTDSSVAPRRFDGPLTTGGMRKINWLVSPRQPYFLDSINPFRRGKTDVLEIPASSFVAGYGGTTMRISPKLNALVGNKLYYESKGNSNPIVFLFHPTELVTEKRSETSLRRSRSFFSYVFGDLIRNRLKTMNLGKSSMKLLGNVLKKGKAENCDFVSAIRYRSIYKSNITK